MAPVATTHSHALPSTTPADVTKATSHTSTSLASNSSYTLDYADWDSPLATDHSRDKFLHALRVACAGVGFFYLKNTPLDMPLQPGATTTRKQRLFDVAKKFFALPLEQRQRILMENSSAFRGYCLFGSERTQNQVDHRDQIDVGPEVDPLTDPELLARYPFLHLYGRNPFLPDDVLEGHREATLDWFDTCTRLSRSLTNALEAALQLPHNALVRFLDGPGVVADRKPTASASSPSSRGGGNDGDEENGNELEAKLGAMPYARMKLIRYPNAKRVDGVDHIEGSQQGVGAHKDGGWMTLLATDDQPGLQVQDLSGDWLDVPTVPGAIIVNFGQQIERCSSGLIQAATHRVLSNGASGVPRYSLAWFAVPSLTTVVRPILSLASEAHPAADADADGSGGVAQLFRRELERANAERRAHGVEQVRSDVPRGDLWGGEDTVVGEMAWSGIVRSHPNVYERWHAPGAPRVPLTLAPTSG